MKKYFDTTDDIDIFFVSDKTEGYKDAINIYDIDTIMKLDYLIICGANYEGINKNILDSDVKVIWWHMGNTFIHDTNKILIGEQASTLIDFGCNKFHEAWISPHFEYSIDYYRYNYGNINVGVCPYIWEPVYMEAPYTNDFTHNDINIGVFESNLNVNKSSFIPIIICERAKDIINTAFIGCSRKLWNQSADFKKYNKKSSLFKEKRLTIEERHRFKYVMDNVCNVVVSCVDNWDLNYLFLECFYLGIPLVHNSKMLKDWGYYYEGCNVNQAVTQIKCIKETFNRKAYINRHAPLLYKYSMKNPEYIKFFKDHLVKEYK